MRRLFVVFVVMPLLGLDFYLCVTYISPPLFGLFIALVSAFAVILFGERAHYAWKHRETAAGALVSLRRAGLPMLGALAIVVVMMLLLAATSSR